MAEKESHDLARKALWLGELPAGSSSRNCPHQRANYANRDCVCAEPSRMTNSFGLRQPSSVIVRSSRATMKSLRPFVFSGGRSVRAASHISTQL